MICPICQINQATVHITDLTTINKVFHICSECVKYLSQTAIFCKEIDELKDLINKGPSKPDNKINFLNLSKNKDLVASLFDESPQCPNCGTDITKILTSGVISCPEEYEIYEEMIEKIFEDIFKATRHKGKKYNESLTAKKLSKLTSLQFDLQKAIEAENYELAGELNKQIKEIKEDEA